MEMRKCNYKSAALFLVGFFALTSGFAQISTGRSDEEDEEDSALTMEYAQLAMAEPNYKVCAGDVYQLAFMYNTTAVSYTITVDSSYKIRVASFGTLNVAGKTYSVLKDEVESIVTKNFPLAGPQFVLIKPAVFFVKVDGEVNTTTEVKAWGLDRLSTVIEGLLTSYSSSRSIKVTSSDGKVSEYDLFLASRFGELEQNPYVKPGDRISVGRVKRKVNISGEVERPGEYELLDGENMTRLIEYYGGGLTDFADLSRVRISRYIAENENTNYSIYLSENDVAGDYALKNYDKISIPSYNDLNPVIFIEGAISVSEGASLEATNRRTIHVSKGLNYSTLVRQNSSLFGATSDLENSYIKRGDEQIPINLFDILYDATKYSDLEAEPYDVLIIPFRQFFVTVSGAVNNPGRFPYIPGRKWDYYLGLAGGFVKTQNSWEAVDITDIDGNKLSKKDEIPPESNINARANSFGFYFNQYAPIFTTILSIISSVLSIYLVVSRQN